MLKKKEFPTLKVFDHFSGYFSQKLRETFFHPINPKIVRVENFQNCLDTDFFFNCFFIDFLDELGNFEHILREKKVKMGSDLPTPWLWEIPLFFKASLRAI